MSEASSADHHHREGDSSAAAAAAAAETRASKLAAGLHRALEDAAAAETREYAVILKKKQFKQVESRYIVKLRGNKNDAGGGNGGGGGGNGNGLTPPQVLSEGCRFALAATMGTMARMCGLGVGTDLADDLCTLGTHTLLSDLLRRPGCQPDLRIATRGCHALGNMLDVCGAGAARLERQAEFAAANVPVALANTLQFFPADVECAISALRLCSLLCHGSKAAAKACRRVGIVGHVQAILVLHAERGARTKQLVLQPAKACLQDLWFGAKKKRLVGEAP